MRYAIRYTIYDIRYTSYANRRITPKTHRPPNKPPILPRLSTNYNLFMQNKPNFLDDPMNVTKVLTRDYENETLSRSGKNKANSKPNKANSNPISPETNPIQSQYEPKQTQLVLRSLWRSRIRRQKMLLIFTLLEVLANSVGRSYYLEPIRHINHRRLP